MKAGRILGDHAPEQRGIACGINGSTSFMIKLTNVSLDGFAATNALPGDTVKVVTRGVMTSDESSFYLIMKSLWGLIGTTGIRVMIDQLTRFALIIHSDKS